MGKNLVPVVIVLVITGIFIFKNSDKGNSTADSQPTVTGSAVGSKEIDYSSVEFDLDATEDFDLDKIFSYGLPVIIDFGTDSCIPCKEVARYKNRLVVIQHIKKSNLIPTNLRNKKLSTFPEFLSYNRNS